MGERWPNREAAGIAYLLFRRALETYDDKLDQASWRKKEHAPPTSSAIPAPRHGFISAIPFLRGANSIGLPRFVVAHLLQQPAQSLEVLAQALLGVHVRAVIQDSNRATVAAGLNHLQHAEFAAALAER